MTTVKEGRFDVFIVEIATSKIEAVVGTNLTADKADRREMTALSRINDRYFVVSEPTGVYKKDDILK